MTSVSTREMPIAVSMGDPAGIGGDILLKAWSLRKTLALPPFVAVDSLQRLQTLAGQLGLSVPIREVSDMGGALAAFPEALPVLPISLAAPVHPGRLDAANAPGVMASLTSALELVRTGAAAALLTNPIHKQTLYSAGFEHPGHTEFLAEETGSSPVMMLSCPGLRVIPVTIHIPLSDVPALLTEELIVERGRVAAEALRQDFGLKAPRLSVAALNPHGGESGALGREEETVIAPAVKRLQNMGYAVQGPFPADTLFHAQARENYDAVLAMYHDQALIPLKTIDFDNGVNTTLGLPIVRTSPDHGTACDIAGTGKANPSSFIAALRQADEIARNRAEKS